MILSQIWNFVYSTIYTAFLRSPLKILLRLLTGRCELVRIALTYYNPDGTMAWKTIDIENSLKHSKAQALKRILTENNVNIDQAVSDIMKIKTVSPDTHPEFGPTLKVCLSQICGYRQLIQEVDTVRRIPYSSDNPEHEQLLLELWNLLMPYTKLKSRINKQWTEIGFQQEDPMTDFRGMGMLGLQNLIYLASKHPEIARQLLMHSHHPKFGYSFAIVGINITSVAFQLLCSGQLKTHFYNAVQGKPTLEHFHQVYCYLMYEFDKFWFEEQPEDIMQFNPVKNKFVKNISNQLKNKCTQFRCTFIPYQRKETHV